MSEVFPMIPLGELLIKSEERTEIDPEVHYQQVRVRLWGKGVVLREEVAGIDIAASKQFVVKANQFILSKIDARNGAFGLVPASLDGAVVSSDFPVFTPNRSLIIPEFLNWMSKTRNFVNLCSAASEGTTNRVRLKEDRFLATKIPLPPFEEQLRIIARIEELVDKIEKAQNFHQKALAAAADLYDSTVATILTTLSDAETVLVENIAEVRGGIQKSPNRAPGSNPVRYLTVAHVHRDHISSDDPRFFEVSPAELNLWKLESGDVLVIEGNGSADQIGRAALFRGEIDQCVHQNHVIRIRPNQKRIDPEFLNIYFNSPVGKQEIQSRSRTTSGLRTLSVGRIKQTNVIVPSLSTQQYIIKSLKSLQLKVNILNQRQAETSAKLNAMLPSILDRAFKGEL